MKDDDGGRGEWAWGGGKKTKISRVAHSEKKRKEKKRRQGRKDCADKCQIHSPINPIPETKWSLLIWSALKDSVFARLAKIRS